MKNVTLILSLALSLLFVGCAGKEAKVEGAPEIVSAYLDTTYQDVASVEAALESVGLEVLGSAVIGKGKSAITSVVFTHPSLVTLAKANGREFVAGSMRVLVNEEKNLISVTNPMYFLKAYLQETFVVVGDIPIAGGVETV